MAQIAKSRVVLQSDHVVTFFFVFPYAQSETVFLLIPISRLRRVAEGPY